MFTIEQIHGAFAKVKSGTDFPKFVQDLKELGVTHYENAVADGRTVYYGADHYSIEDKPKYPNLDINDTGSAEKLSHALLIHQKGETDYLTFCAQSAEAGVEKWITHMIDMTVSYLDKAGNELVVEAIPLP